MSMSTSKQQESGNAMEQQLSREEARRRAQQLSLNQVEAMTARQRSGYQAQFKRAEEQAKRIMAHGNVNRASR